MPDFLREISVVSTRLRLRPLLFSALFAGALASFLAVAGWAVSTDRIPFNADQAVVGLMARHILEGRGHPVFYYGATYAGSLEPHFVALAFRALGASVESYRLAMAALSALLVAGIGALTARTFGIRAGAFALFYLAIPPYFFLYKNLTSDGAYLSVALLALASVAAALRWDEQAAVGRSEHVAALAFGLSSGAGIWVTPVCLPVSVGCALWLAGRLRRTRWWRSAPAAVAGLLAGSSPWWIWNLRHGWASLNAAEVRTSSMLTALANSRAIVTEAFPVLVGSFPPLFLVGEQGSFPGAAVVVPLLVAGLLLPVIPAAFRGERRAALFFLCFVMAVGAACLSSRFVGNEPRYLVSFYPLILPLLGYSAARISRARGGLAAMAGLFVLLGATNALGVAKARRHTGILREDEVTGSLEPVLKALSERGLDRVWTNYWASYRISFESGERILAAPLPWEYPSRYPPIQAAVASSSNPAVILFPPRADCFRSFLEETGGAWQEERRGDASLFFSLPGAVVDSIRRAGGLPLPANAYRVAWEETSVPAIVNRGGAAARLSFRNLGPCRWMGTVHVGYRWRPEAGGEPIAFPDRVFMNRSLGPGEKETVGFTLRAPAAPGRYVVTFDLVNEMIAWFSQKGADTISVNVEVR